MGATSLESFVEELALNGGVHPAGQPPPKLLLPDETPSQYERRFEQWLSKRKLTLAALRDPTVERLFRVDFAMSRAWELHCMELNKSKTKADKKSEIERPPTARENGTASSSPPYRRTRSRSELLETRVMTADEFVEEMQDVNKFGPNGYIRPTSRLKPIPVILRPSESRKYFEVNFEHWMVKKDLTMKALEGDPEEERRLRQCFAYSRALEHISRGTSRRQRSRSPSRRSSDSTSQSRSKSQMRSLSREVERTSRKRSASRERSHREADPADKRMRHDGADRETRTSSTSAGLPEDLPDWARELIESTKQRALQVDRRFEELERKIRTVRFSCTASKSDNESSVTTTKKPNDTPQVAANITTKSKDDGNQHRSTDSYKAAAETLEKSMIIGADTEQQRLVEEYTRLADQIVMNETAIEDSRAYAMQIMTIDKAEATEHLNQIKELTVSINQEKQHRDAALVAVIVHDWRGKKSELLRLVRAPTQILDSGGSRDKLCAVYSQLKRKDAEVIALRSKLKDRLGEQNVHNAEHCKEVSELSSRLADELDERSKLDVERDTLSQQLVLSNKCIRARLTSVLK